MVEPLLAARRSVAGPPQGRIGPDQRAPGTVDHAENPHAVSSPWMMKVARISVTPVKGTRLVHPDEVELTPWGIPGNRRFFLVDHRGALFSGGHHGPLVQVGSRYDPTAGLLELTLPGADPIAAPVDRSAGPIVVDFYGRPVPGRLVDGPFAETLSTFVGRPIRLVMADQEGAGSDVHHLSLVGLASVRDLGTRNDRPDLDPSRFRMDLELEGCSPFEEESWQGQELHIGAATVRVGGRIPRCVVTTQDPRTGRKDFDTLKRIAAFRPFIEDPRGVGFGMYAEVVRPGRIRTGDTVTLTTAAATRTGR
jgi:uncharacterized protein YcbX